jgi:hypothetical protein
MRNGGTHRPRQPEEPGPDLPGRAPGRTSEGAAGPVPAPHPAENAQLTLL